MTVGQELWRLWGEPWRLLGRLFNDNSGLTDQTLDVSITTSLATTQAIDMRGFSGLGLYVPADVPLGSCTFYGCYKEDGTYLPIEGAETGENGVQVISAGKCKEVKPYIFPVHWLKIVGTGAGNVAAMLKG